MFKSYSHPFMLFRTHSIVNSFAPTFTQYSIKASNMYTDFVLVQHVVLLVWLTLSRISSKQLWLAGSCGLFLQARVRLSEDINASMMMSQWAIQDPCMPINGKDNQYFLTTTGKRDKAPKSYKRWLLHTHKHVLLYTKCTLYILRRTENK